MRHFRPIVASAAGGWSQIGEWVAAFRRRSSFKVRRGTRRGVGWRTVEGGLLLLLLFALACAGQTLRPQRVNPTGTAVVNFTQLAQQEARQPPRGPTGPISPPVIIPVLPVPPGATVVPRARAGALPQAKVPPPPPLIMNIGSGRSFAGADDNGTTRPSDAHGAVGPNHVMTTANDWVLIQTRIGTQVSKVSLMGFWAPLGGLTTVYDPRLLYDVGAQRWIFVSAANPNTTKGLLLLAVSQGSNPTGAWKQYKFTDANNRWLDYPSVGFNDYWIVASTNEVDTGGTFPGTVTFAFSKTDVYGWLTSPWTAIVPAPASMGGTLVPIESPHGNSSPVYLVQNGWQSSSQMLLRLYSLAGTPPNPVFTVVSYLTPTGNWSATSVGAPQSGTTTKIVTNDARLQQCVFANPYVYCAMTAFLPANAPTRASVNWFKILPGGTPSIAEEGLIDDPSGNQFYAFPSLAVTAGFSMVVGFSVFSPNKFASAAFAGRLPSDPPGTLRPIVLIKAGKAAYAPNRWGDYSHTVIDPIETSSFWTVQNYAEAPSSKWGTWWGGIVVLPANAQ